jgi:RNA polymerase sigma-70 factor (ECF subfamily)
LRYSADYLGKSPESILVALARSGNRDAFAELVRRREAWIRNLMRRCCHDASLADDLAQQTFMQAWRSLLQLQEPGRFAPWLKRIAVNAWLQHKRRDDPLEGAIVEVGAEARPEASPALGMDLDMALSQLAGDARLCIVLAYHERMTHGEIAEFTGLPPGTVKSHIRRGTAKLQQALSAYLATGEDSI